MSHFNALVLVKPDSENIEKETERLLAPFNENTDVEPYKRFLDEEDINIMREYYQREGKISKGDDSLESLVTLLEDWHGHEGGIEEGHIYYLTTYNPMSKWDWYVIGGRWDGAIENNRLKMCEIPEDFTPFAVVTEHGWHERGKMLWFGMVAEEKDDWTSTFKKLKKEHQDYTAVLCDLHI